MYGSPVGRAPLTPSLTSLPGCPPNFLRINFDGRISDGGAKKKKGAGFVTMKSNSELLEPDGTPLSDISISGAELRGSWEGIQYTVLILKARHVILEGPPAKPRVGSSQPSEASLKRKRGVFQKDLQHMMYGFGDDPNPLPETVALVEDIIVEYITDLVHKAQDIGSKRGKLLTEDFLYLIRKDSPKLHRCTELLSMNEELKQARKAFDVSEENLATAD
ncbi:putative Transcription initiation factor TFIID subunit 13 [Cocos nucifera]|uniref:Transcription initiation factor TFIID subunit 13 n=1 Tax=Cocos nucifera TaxID=13894 RepID=A0A8K0NB06_COCNU|nr:putative Transcription initiation factor TFIID subunit 13 [Cocos nucifera]